ncbi:MAG: LysE family translocator [Deinococcales bacterium]|nr:LysE family translocator [Chitinophagaceae bacterium]
MLPGLFKGIVLGLLLAVSVGPVIFAIIKQSINNGHKAGYAFIAGISISDISVVLICNFFSNIFQAALSHQKAIALIGGSFLIALGVYTFFFKKEPHEDIKLEAKILRKRELAGIFVSGYLINILNPGIFLFWLAWSTTIFADAATEAHPIQYRIVVFGTCLLIVLISDILKVQLAGILKPKLTPKNLHRINQFVGILMIGFGVFLIVKQLFLTNK